MGEDVLTMRLAAILAIFCLPIIGGVAKHTVFGGAGPIWPFFLAACAVAAIYDWKAALLIGIGIGGAQFIERNFGAPVLLQFGLYGALVFIAIWARLGAITYTTLAIVSALYFAAQVEVLAWFPAVVVSEFALTFGLIGVTWHGGGGVLSRNMAAASDRGSAGIHSLLHAGRAGDIGGDLEGMSVATRSSEEASGR